MGLPYQPEPLSALRERYPRALQVIYDVESIKLGVASTPGKFRSNVFDFHDGLRLIVSRDRHEDGVVALHLSASIQSGGAVYRSLRRNVLKMHQRMKKISVQRFRTLSGDQRELKFLLWMNCVPNWIIEEDKCPKKESLAPFCL